MKVFDRHIPTVAFAALSLVACTTAPSSPATQEAAALLAAAPAASSLLFENEFVRVTRVAVPAGASLPSHFGERRIIYSLSDYEISWAEEGEEAALRKWFSGDVHFHEAGQHSLTNVGSTTAEFVVFERREADLPADSEKSLIDAQGASPETTELLFENDAFRILRVELPPGASQPVHDGRPRAIYTLSDYELEWLEDGQVLSSRKWKTGDVHWHPAGEHAAKNAGTTTARWLIVSFKD